MTRRLPSVGGDSNEWGTVLNDFLSFSVNDTITKDPTDPSQSSVFFANMHWTLDWAGSSPGIDGPSPMTGFFGPRGVFQLEGVMTTNYRQGQYSLAPLSFVDQLLVRNNPGQNAAFTPAWHFCAFRMYAAEGTTINADRTDINIGPAAFIDQHTYLSTGGGQLNLTQDADHEHISFLSWPTACGNVTINRRIGYWAHNMSAIGATNGSTLTGVLGDRITYPVDNGTVAVGTQIGALVDRLTGATNNYGIVCDSPVLLWSDSPTLTTAPSAAALKFGAGGEVLTYNYASPSHKNIHMTQTVKYKQAPSGFLGTMGILYDGTITNDPTFTGSIAFADAFEWSPTVKGDTNATTMTAVRGFLSAPVVSTANSGTLAVTNVIGVTSGLTVNAGGTVTNMSSFTVSDATGAGTVTNQYGIDIANLTKGATKNRPIRLGTGRGIELANDTAHDTTTTLPASSMSIYQKGNNIVFAYNDAGTMRFLYAPLTGVGTTWTHDTTGP